MTKSYVNIPVDSIYELQRSLSGVEIAAYLTADPISEKKPSRLTDVAFHSVRPWLAAIDPKGTGIVWNYETRETVAEFSLGISSDTADGDGGDDEFGGSGTPTAKTLLQKTASPTTSYVKALRSKASTFAMLFYDHESICWTTRSAEPRMFFEEWIVILTATHVVLCDLNQPTAIRSVSADELQRQAPCSIEILPSGLLAIGCQDGKIRLWSPRLWRVVDTIDTGSTKEVQQLLLLPLRGSAAAAGPLDVVHFLTTVTVDGRIVTWKVSQSGECVKVPGVIELRDFYRAFDTGNGLSELRWHEHQEIVSGASKDGTVYFFDLTPLTKQSKQMTLMSILPTTKLPGASVLAGPRKGAFVVISLGASGSSVTTSELVNKGRAMGRDNVPANYLEFAVGSSIESRDLRLPVGQAALKKFKMLSLCANPRNPDELCCVTSFGLFVLRATCLTSSRPIMISRGAGKSPLVLYPGPCRITLRFYGEDTSSKQEDYKFQAAADAPNERLKTPSLLACPSNASLMSAVLPASTHVEVIQMDSELRNQKSINMHAVFSGNGIALAWHATKPRFAVLVPQDSNARRLTRAVSNVNAPKRRGFMFGGSTKGMGDDASAAAEARQRSSAARAMTLAMYDISAEGHVQSAAESCSCGDDRLLHIFSGPVLGVVKFEADAESGSLGGASTSFVGASELHDSPSMRNKRTESSMFSPTGGGSSASLSFADNDSGDLKKTTLEFFDWDCGPSGGSLKRIGSAAIDAPLKIEWERATHRFCALVYPKAVKIYRVTTAPVAEVVCLHEIPTPQTAQSLKWMHHTLFFSTDDEIKCCVISKTRVFSFDIGSRLGFLEAPTSSMGSVGDPSLQFPVAQKFVSDATTILDVCNQQLVLVAPVQSLHSLELSNRVLQCCILISIGQADLALQVANTIPGELADWIASVFEAFAFVAPAMRLSKISLPCMVNMAIKHNLLDDLERLLQSPATLDRLPDSRDTSGTSLLQRACTCLHRGGRKEAVERVCRLSTSSGRSTDAIFLASLLNNDELFASALEAQDVWPGAFHSAKRGNLSAPSGAQDMLKKWNSQLHSATAPWKTVLSRNAIRAPENLTLTLS